MMSNFKFKVEEVSHLLSSKKTLLYGEVLEGKVLIGESVNLMSNEVQNEIVIEGVVLGDSRPKASKFITLVINSSKNENAINLMKEGDFLIGN
jgi:hypothetical protein